MPQTTEQHFRTVAPVYMRLLLTDFPELGPEDAAAIFGNAGHESKGLTDDQEDKPVVKGSRGGLNWMQWTGPRRKAMEAYCARNKLDPTSDIAAYKWLFLELKGPEGKRAIPALLKAATLEQKVVAFEKAFLRAGVKHYPSRQRWAKIALEAMADHVGNTDTGAIPEPVPAPPVEDYEESLAPAPGRTFALPGWLPLLVIAILSLIVGAVVWLGQGMGAEEVSLIGGVRMPMDRPAALFGGGSLAGEIGLQIALAFVAPLVSAAATAVVGWIVYWWQRVLKADFDAKSADALHKALERAGLAALDALGARASKAKQLAFMADYAATNNPGAVRHFKLSEEKLQQLAIPHLVSAKAKAA